MAHVTVPRYISPGLTGSTTKWNALTVATRAEWGSTTPLGTPSIQIRLKSISVTLVLNNIYSSLFNYPSWLIYSGETLPL